MSSKNKKERQARPITMIRWYRLNQANLSVPQFCQGVGIYTTEGYGIDVGTKKCGAKLRERVAAVLNAPIEDLFDDAGWPLLADVGAEAEVAEVTTV